MSKSTLPPKTRDSSLISIKDRAEKSRCGISKSLPQTVQYGGYRDYGGVSIGVAALVVAREQERP